MVIVAWSGRPLPVLFEALLNDSEGKKNFVPACGEPPLLQDGQREMPQKKKVNSRFHSHKCKQHVPHRCGLVPCPAKNPKPREILFISYSLLFIHNNDRIHATVHLLITCIMYLKNPPNVGVYKKYHTWSLWDIFLVIFSMAPAVSHRAFPLSTAKLEDSDSLDWRASDAISSCIYGCLDVLLVLEGWDKCCFLKQNFQLKSVML